MKNELYQQVVSFLPNDSKGKETERKKGKKKKERGRKKNGGKKKEKLPFLCLTAS